MADKVDKAEKAEKTEKKETSVSLPSAAEIQRHQTFQELALAEIQDALQFLSADDFEKLLAMYRQNHARDRTPNALARRAEQVLLGGILFVLTLPPTDNLSHVNYTCVVNEVLKNAARLKASLALLQKEKPE